MPLRAAAIVGVIAFLIPLFARAEQVTVWDFTGGKVPGEWQLRNITGVQPMEQGLRIRTPKAGFLFRPVPPDTAIDALSITVASTKETEASVLWHEPDEPEGRLTQRFYTIPESKEPVTVDIAPSPGIEHWDRNTDAIGLGFPEGTDIIITKIELRRWNAAEKATEMFKSFWHMDDFRPYSINFLWGPLITTTPPAREEMFHHLPPRAISALRIFYGILILAGIGAAAALLRRNTSDGLRRKLLATCSVSVIALWLLFDLRMGYELIGYAATDVRTHVLPPRGEKTLRTHGRFYDVARQALPMLTSVPAYVLVTLGDSPYWQNLRYMTYPSLPVLPDGDLSGVRLMFVLERPDIRVEGDRVVNSDGSEIAHGGQVIRDFGSGSFLYMAQ